MWETERERRVRQARCPRSPRAYTVKVEIPNLHHYHFFLAIDCSKRYDFPIARSHLK